MFKRAQAVLLAAGICAAFSGCGSSTTGPGAIGSPTPTATATATATPTTAPTATASATAAPVLVITISGIMGSSSFSPSLAAATAGQKIRWKNGDVITHRIVDNGAAFDTGDIAPGTSSVGITLGAGAFPYHCSIHPSMTGTLTVSN